MNFGGIVFYHRTWHGLVRSIDLSREQLAIYCWIPFINICIRSLPLMLAKCQEHFLWSPLSENFFLFALAKGKVTTINLFNKTKYIDIGRQQMI